jgi:hypothetical protein
MPTGATSAPIGSRLVSQLRSAGLNLDTLPAHLASLPAPARDTVMQTFTTSLGIDCTGCHDAADLSRPTPKSNIAARMWSDFVAQLTFSDGRPLYCDSCHQGRATFLDRSDTHALGLWMEKYFIDGLARRDGRTQDCFTCHGSPFDPNFLGGWAAGGAY